MHFMRVESINQTEQKIENVLDLIPNRSLNDRTIHTFTDFKHWLNKYEVKRTNARSPVKSSFHKAESFKFQDNSEIMISSYPTAKEFGSLQIRALEHKQQLKLAEIEERKQHLESSQIEVREERRRRVSDQFELSVNLVSFPFDQLSFSNKSGHSSRSFNGYEQINQYELRKVIGKGAFSCVYLGRDVKTLEEYAIKVMESKLLRKKLFMRKNNSEDTHLPSNLTIESEFINNEVALMKKMNHQYITKLYEVIVDDQHKKVYLVLQYSPNGFINEKKDEKGVKHEEGRYRRLLESECKRYLKQLSFAMHYIHDVVKIAHRDIKPENILLSNHDEIRLSDFGLSTDRFEGEHRGGTKLYMPPENRDGDPQRADIWAIGVTLLTLLTGKHPEYSGVIPNLDKLISSIKDISEECKSFLEATLEKDPKKRITAEGMLDHPWIAANDDIRRSNPGVKEICLTSSEAEHAFNAVTLLKKARKNDQS